MSTRHRRSTVLLSALLVPFLVACSGVTEVTVRNATRSTITARVRVDRVGPRGLLLASADLKPGEQTTLSSEGAPALEYVELAVWRAGDLGDLPVTKRVPRGKSRWTVASDAESWTGFSIIEGVEGEPSSVSPAE